MPIHRDVFISSTSIDLPAYRQAVRDAILSLGWFPSGMEHWPVTGENPVALCKQMIEDSEVYIGIYAHRYGWRPDGYDGKSITELEFDWAGAIQRDGKPMPRLCFIMKDDHPWPKDQMEIEAEADLKRFKARVKAFHAGFFTTPEDLKAQVSLALAQLKAASQPPDAPFIPAPGVTFEHYILDELLDEGGNGQVWRARERLPDESYRPVAIKFLKPGIAADTRRVERFKKEIAAARRLNHPHILRALDYGLHRGQFFVVMDFIEGQTLRHQLKGKPLPTELVITWLSQIAGALQEAHDNDNIHRDVKPENILYRRRGETDHLYLTDFGLVYSSEIEQHITGEGDLVGTGRYMSPEQCNPDYAPVSNRSDLYALAIMAYELLTGSLPFSGPNKVVLCQQHLTEALPRHPALPDSLYRVLAKGAAKHPADRYASVTDFIRDLRRWQDDPANLEPVIAAYAATLEKRLRDLVLDRFVELAGDERSLRAHLSQVLETSFDPLAGFSDYDGFFQSICAPVEADHIRAEDPHAEYVPNVRERLIQIERAVLVGEPGAGKTWMMYRLALTYAAACKADPAAPIPVLVPLNQYNGTPDFLAFVRGRAGALGTHLEALLRQGRIVLLCDALNEMPKTHLEAVRGYLKGIRRFVVSCRVRDYRDELNTPELQPLEQVILRDMELPAIHEFITRRLGDSVGEALWGEMGGAAELLTFWKKVQAANEGPRFWEANTNWWELKIKDFYGAPNAWRAMHSGARLIPLARNPFTAQMICGIYESEKAIEKNRAALFKRFVESLLKREQSNAARQGLAFPRLETIESGLVALAKAMQAAKRTVLPIAEAETALADPIAADLLKAATDANILASDGDGLKFAHQLLQEYFAARVLLEALEAEADPAPYFAAGEGWWDAGVWRETTVILGEFLGGAAGANRVARWLAPVTPEVALLVITRHAAGLTLTDLEESTRTALIHSARAKTAEADPRGRAAAYRVLGLLDADDREGIGLRPDGLPDLRWAEAMLAGDYPLGDDEQAYDVITKGVKAYTATILQDWRISKYLITQAQYLAFQQDDSERGYACPDWWRGLAASERDKVHAAPAFPYLNHPMEQVNWYQAVAFCRWLTWHYRQAGVIGREDEIRLPHEYEWEAAARGRDGRFYSYAGDFDSDKGNTSDTGIRQTSAVGIFPAGAAFCGALDMTGNVWEWCLNLHESPEVTAHETDLASTDARCLRGGSWHSLQVGARAASRNRNFPFNWNNNIGFRVVWSSPIPVLLSSERERP